jgi:hypothetical protein
VAGRVNRWMADYYLERARESEEVEMQVFAVTRANDFI